MEGSTRSAVKKKTRRQKKKKKKEEAVVCWILKFEEPHPPKNEGSYNVM